MTGLSSSEVCRYCEIKKKKRRKKKDAKLQNYINMQKNYILEMGTSEMRLIWTYNLGHDIISIEKEKLKYWDWL